MNDHRRSRRADRHRAEGQNTQPHAPVSQQDHESVQQGHSPNHNPIQRSPFDDTGRQPTARRSAYGSYATKGQPDTRNAAFSKKNGPPFYRSPLLMLILLLLLPPVGIFLLWKFGRQMRTVKLVLTAISVLWLALLVFLFTRNLRTPPQVVEPPADGPGVEMTVSGPEQQTANANDSAVQVVDIYAGSDVVGKRAFLTIPTEATLDFTGKELAAIADTNVQGQGYGWFTVVMDDGSGEGYVFTGDSTDTVTYGILSDDGTIAAPDVMLRRAGNDYVAE